jgi:hypothetical protein
MVISVASGKQYRMVKVLTGSVEDNIEDEDEDDKYD